MGRSALRRRPAAQRREAALAEGRQEDGRDGGFILSGDRGATGKGYSVYFPDLPGCTLAGATLQEAARRAEEALAAYLILSAEQGDAIPEPSDIDACPADPEVEEAARLLVRVEPPGRALRLNVTLDEGLVAAIDRVAENRSAYLAAAARRALASGLEVGAGRKRRQRHKGAAN